MVARFRLGAIAQWSQEPYAFGNGGRRARKQAEDTANIVGGREQFGSRGYGLTVAHVPADPSTVRLRQLSSLFDEEMPDLLAASCLSRRSVEYVRHGTHEPTADTLAALELAMQLLNPNNPQGMAGWREIVTAEELAQVLDSTCQDAKDRFRGWKTWKVSEREGLVLFLMERRSRLN